MLPKINVPKYELTLPSSKKKIFIRPFLAREEKILLMALEDETNAEATILRALKEIITNCVVSKIDLDKLPRIDIEYIFLHLRKHSVGETIDLEYNARELFECSQTECIEKIKTKLPIDNIDIKNVDNLNKKIMLSDDVGVVLKPISLFDEKIYSSENDSNVEQIFNIVAKMIDKIFTMDDIIEIDRMSENELSELPKWIEDSFSRNSLNQVMEFISQQPSFYTKINIQCPKCGIQKEIEANNIFDFFI